MLPDRPRSRNPKFRIGDDVIAVGTAQVRRRKIFGFTLRATIHCKARHEGSVVDRAIDADTKMIIYKIDGAPRWWAENCLRRKHKPSSKSFAEIIHSLKTGVNV